MKKINTNTIRGILAYLELTKKSNTINTWLLGINSAILLFIINRLTQPSDFLRSLIAENIFFKTLCLILFIWITINVIILIIYTYKERVLSLTIEDKYYRLKSFLSYMDNIDSITEDELLDKDIFEIRELTNRESTSKAIEEYTNDIIKYSLSILKWSNKRLFIYRIVILASIPLLLGCCFIIIYNI